MRAILVFLLLLGGSFCVSSVAVAQDDSTSQLTTACTFDDGHEMSIRYNSPEEKKPQSLSMGKVWAPGGAPLVLFTQAPIVLNRVEIPAGAYRMYVIPGKQTWTLIVNRNVTAGSGYDESQDLVRAPMETAMLSQPGEGLKVSLGHIAPKVCSLRVYYDKVGAWTEFNAK